MKTRPRRVGPQTYDQIQARYRAKAVRRLARADSRRRKAMVWMLLEAGHPAKRVARELDVSAKQVYQLAREHEQLLVEREESAWGWAEPWALRLRVVGAIP